MPSIFVILSRFTGVYLVCLPFLDHALEETSLSATILSAMVFF